MHELGGPASAAWQQRGGGRGRVLPRSRERYGLRQPLCMCFDLRGLRASRDGLWGRAHGPWGRQRVHPPSPTRACAGGWTHVLAQRARRVIAVDPAALDPRALACPAVTHLACKAEDAVEAIKGMVGETGVDLLVSGARRAVDEGGGREA